MNPNSKRILSNKQSQNKLEQRVKELENLTAFLTSKIEEDSQKRLETESSYKNEQAKYTNEIQLLKNNLENLSHAINNKIVDTVSTMSNQLNNKTNELKKLIEENIERQNALENSKSTDNLYIVKAISLEENIKNKIEEFDKDCNSRLKSFSEQINSNSVRLNFMEKKIFENNAFLTKQIESTNKQLINCQNDMNILINTKCQNNENCFSLTKKISEQEEMIRNYSNKISSQINDFQNILKEYNDTIENEKNILKTQREEITQKFNELYEKFFTENDNIKGFIDNEFKMYQNEIENLEKHVINEQENFTKFVQQKMNINEKKINNNLKYVDEDIKKIKEKIEVADKNNDDYKEKIFAIINEMEEYSKKKYEIIIRILTRNGLLNDNFDYNNVLNNKGFEMFELGIGKGKGIAKIQSNFIGNQSFQSMDKKKERDNKSNNDINNNTDLKNDLFFENKNIISGETNKSKV